MTFHPIVYEKGDIKRIAHCCLKIWRLFLIVQPYIVKIVAKRKDRLTKRKKTKLYTILSSSKITKSFLRRSQDVSAIFQKKFS